MSTHPATHPAGTAVRRAGVHGTPTSLATHSRIASELGAATELRLEQLRCLPMPHDDPVAAAQREALLQTVSDIESAVRRLEDGTFGTCVRCREPIPLERLEFRLWSATCVPCAAP